MHKNYGIPFMVILNKKEMAFMLLDSPVNVGMCPSIMWDITK